MTGKIAVGGITKADNLVLIRVLSARRAPGLAGSILSSLGQRRINLICVTSFVDGKGRDNIGFAVAEDHLDQVLGLLQPLREEIAADSIEYQRHCCSVSVYGPHFSERPAIAGLIFDATAAAGIDIHMISSSFSTVSCIIDQEHGDVAVNRLRETFVIP